MNFLNYSSNCSCFLRNCQNQDINDIKSKLFVTEEKTQHIYDQRKFKSLLKFIELRLQKS